ncbi:hypothetical protein BU24DRAFT_425205 [Aaosphaeria arxii CBS 175.79]|uniref:Secreted protein n=1 Tax=Aaosphaeria arxii CBS 175.79 TaxID=1450172 RepID=A0A6A5XI95_9PLEO|nr:uncharacterized protein BU24DRAFT_425205 [Aaosphaeria arxii CBS 175.79]KAF2012567.1 hypothetical protein BU24DRAFT_425205 [Aaosphaeria arxii CBS 175.79]
MSMSLWRLALAVGIVSPTLPSDEWDGRDEKRSLPAKNRVRWWLTVVDGGHGGWWWWACESRCRCTRDRHGLYARDLYREIESERATEREEIWCECVAVWMDVGVHGGRTAAASGVRPLW